MRKLVALFVLTSFATVADAQTVKHHAKHVRLTWCDIHACTEKPRYLGTASYYGKHYWQGRKMADGRRFDYRKLTMASWGITLGTFVRVTNLSNGQSVVVEVTDRGPAHSLRRVADLSQAAAEKLDYTQKGLTVIFIQPLMEIDTESLPMVAALTEPLEPVEDNVLTAAVEQRLP